MSKTYRMWYKYQLLLTMFLLLSVRATMAQNLVVTLNNSTTVNFPIASIQSIKFGANTMILTEFNGTVNSWNIPDINNYAFTPSGPGVNEIMSSLVKIFTVFPNPSSGNINVQFHTEDASYITMEILDQEGRRLSEIYSGNHQGLHTYTWNAELAKGVFYCRISSKNYTITKPFTISL
ncbi:MAG: T9SS type A sorting domain-containing protein [Bacteroidetes bacterium]|nr:T9SS type A sorting domain-containing protein [Bacteroidota bacterium]